MNDFAYCADECEVINCIRNKINISGFGLHSWTTREFLEDLCPLNRITQEFFDRLKENTNHADDAEIPQGTV